MAIISGTTVNWSVLPRIIQIPIPVTDVTIEDLQDTCQDLEDSEIGVVFPKLRQTSGGEDIGDGNFVGWTMKLNNAQIQFQSRTTPQETGTCGADDTTGTLLYAAAGTFITSGVERGHTVFNSTTNAMATVLYVVDNQNLVSQPLAGPGRTSRRSLPGWSTSFPLPRRSGS